MKSNNPHNVKVGQVWKDADTRQLAPRSVIIISVDEVAGTAEVALYQRSGRKIPALKLSRFHGRSNGYRLIQDI